MKLKKSAVFVLRIGIGALFLYAGVIKAWSPDDFLKDVLSYQLLPYSVAVMTVWYLPYLEILCGLSLMLGRQLKESLLVLAGLMAVFLMAIAISWARDLDITCGCFGGSGEANYPWLIFRDLLIGMGLFLIWRMDALADRNHP
ncbi:MAG: MauE/DoxX family redox-associated membrane protein [Verrucomicrobiota bacterium]